ncbi:4-amino-4-deoxy-L-arabinose-phospho-UDP flippase, partial [Pseudomonas aeruginosa]|nr:4-amino-4-deoxy-L-arabinose-phospho-UDP flippase [Pseudomonas aeruginosa]
MNALRGWLAALGAKQGAPPAPPPQRWRQSRQPRPRA